MRYSFPAADLKPALMAALDFVESITPSDDEMRRRGFVLVKHGVRRPFWRRKPKAKAKP